MARCYVRNGVWGWTVADQEKALAEAGVLNPSQLYRDDLPTAKAKMPGRIDPTMLAQRAYLLKPTGRKGGEIIHVATLLAFAVSEADLVAALAQAAARRATVTAADSGLTIAPDAGAASLAAAVADWTRAKKSAQTKPGRRKGSEAAAAAKKARTLEKLPPARALWGKPTHEISSDDIAATVGLSVKTLYAYLGRREVAQLSALRSAGRKRKGDQNVKA